ncbi:MAG TPA: hypothetical protein VMF61_10985 [Candidatus Acidoferrales bacterium]|nr:hypothetical protein [Candidatus Acidoferrales bacterium]
MRATFTFRNQGGAVATGVRVRFNLPDGLVYLVGSGELDGLSQDDELGNSPLLSRGGAHIGDVPPGQERRIEIAYSVAGAIENGTTIELQAAVASFELPPVGSNVVRLIARSRPQLANALTRVSIEARQEPVPGSEAQITVRMHNAGESSAHDVVVVAPIPEHTAYVAGSARVNGRDVERDLGVAFDRLYAPIVAASLAASASATLVFRVRIDAPLPDGTAITAAASVASQETPAFELEPASLVVRAAPDFSDDRTALAVEPAYDVRPGQRVVLTLTAYNAGTAAADNVTATLELPDALAPVRGASSIDGRPVRDRRKDALTFDLGRIDADVAVELRTEAVVVSPLADATTLTPAGVLAWEPARDAAARRLERTLTVRSEPALASRRNAIERVGAAIVKPGSDVELTVALANDGSASASDAVLHLRVDPALDDVRVTEKTARLLVEGDTIDLGTLDAYASRRLTLRARVRTPYGDRSEIRAGASLHTRELGETSLGDVLWTVDSHPAFDAQSSRLELESGAILRPNQLADVDVTLANTGTDVAHNVRLRLYVSPEARLESVDGAIREKSSLVFGEIAPGATARARLGLRLLRSLAKEFPVTVDAVLTADAMLPVPLARLTIATTAEPDFSVGTFRSEPIDVVDVGETVEWVLHVRNGGDGPARRVAIAVGQPETLIYVPNSTTVNDVPVRDVGALAPLGSNRGIVLNEVDPGVEATIRWRDVVHNGLPAGEAIVRDAHVRYDGDRDDEIVSNELKVRATPVFANAIPGLPFGLDGMIGPAFGGQRALTEERFMELPPATPVEGQENANGRAISGLAYPALDAGASADGVYDGNLVSNRVGTSAAFTTERLTRTLRFLDEARFGGLVTHLFALRAFLPDAIGDAHGGALGPLRDQLRDELDRLFIKLRLPGYVIAPRDVETPSLRTTVERVAHEAATARGTPTESPAAAVLLRGGFDPSELAEISERLPDAPLAGALPWAALARFLPDVTPQFAHYRTLLVEKLDALADADVDEFIEALQRRRDAALDAALDVVRTSLHASV